MSKTEYIREIITMLKQSDDEVMLDFIYKMLKRSLHKAA